jgi:hypothetical protein
MESNVDENDQTMLTLILAVDIVRVNMSLAKFSKVEKVRE